MTRFQQEHHELTSTVTFGKRGQAPILETQAVPEFRYPQPVRRGEVATTMGGRIAESPWLPKLLSWLDCSLVEKAATPLRSIQTTPEERAAEFDAANATS